ncbi:translation protein SH3-like domain-containing protein [Bombardia bombarda]|uniref:Translation protein SH3-like domain-containing protein n=1 Tax=Bombardia bombarda TaxID=252184 RepID=A0AA40C157_9PEZI|nr:translation protein SH3-like domain-containing protein [Bombardia bombarda]
MNTAPHSLRPLGCLKAGLRQARQQRALLCRQMATTTSSTISSSSQTAPDHGFYKITDPKTQRLRSAFAVYSPSAIATSPSALAPLIQPSTSSNPSGALARLIVSPASPDPLPALHQVQIKRMDPTGARTALFAKTRHAARVGDVLMVTHRRGGEPFAGVCISIRRAGIDTAILLRNHMGKVGVEMWYKIYNKNVAGIEIVKRRAKRARRARLTYMRQAKHDMGSVSDIVFAWKKTRKVMTTRGGGGGGQRLVVVLRRRRRRGSRSREMREGVGERRGRGEGGVDGNRLCSCYLFC